MAEDISILQLCRATVAGGYDYHREISHAFADPQLTVETVFVRNGLPEAQRRLYTGRVTLLHAERRRHLKRPAPAALTLAWRWRGRRRFALAVCHHFIAARIGVLLQRLDLVKRLALVVHDHDYFAPLDRHGRRRQRFVNRHLGKDFFLVAVSQALLDNVRAWLPAADRHCRVIPHAMRPPQLLGRSQARARLGLPEDAFVIGNIGRLVAYKSQHELIRAFALAAPQMPDAWLALIGDGPQRSALARLSAELGVSERVRLAGFVPQASALLGGFDLFAQTARNEPFGLVLLEALAGATPAVAVASGAAPEILGDPWLLSPADRPEALSAKLIELYRLTPERRRELGQRGRQRAGQTFGIARYHAAYRALLDG